MTEDQYWAAKKLWDEKVKIEMELDRWEKNLDKPKNLAYVQNWNNDHATKLETNIPESVFFAFRESAMNALKIRLNEIEKEFEAL